LGQGGGAVEGLVQVAVDWLGVEADVEAAVGCPDWAFEKAAVEENGGEKTDFVGYAHAWGQTVQGGEEVFEAVEGAPPDEEAVVDVALEQADVVVESRESFAGQLVEEDVGQAGASGGACGETRGLAADDAVEDAIVLFQEEGHGRAEEIDVGLGAANADQKSAEEAE
jgi:hypothetical protein